MKEDPMVQPLLWLLLFDVLVCLVWWGLSSFGILGTAPPRLQQVMLAIVILINVVVIIVWAMNLLGIPAAHLLEGPPRR
jgi:hypothetical protein